MTLLRFKAQLRKTVIGYSIGKEYLKVGYLENISNFCNNNVHYSKS